jgi:anti-sigma factor RsiW
MDAEAQLKLQAFLDGELSDAEAGEVSKWPTQDPEAAALLGELRQTRDALAGVETDLRLPETREFFWSKIEREIGRLEAPAAVAVPWFAHLRRFLMPATAVALLAIAGFVATRQTGSHRVAGGPEAETSIDDTGAFTYRDYAAGTTLVWLSYPAEYELANEDEGSVVD